MVEAHLAVLGGVRLAYEVSGVPDAPPLVLLHALGHDRSDWRLWQGASPNASRSSL